MFQIDKKILDFLLEGDVSIQYQVYRDLLDEERGDLQRRTAKEGWGKHILSKQKPEGHWGDRFYQPKWISSHYTLLDLRNLCIEKSNANIKKAIQFILDNEKGSDGGVGAFGEQKTCDVCVNGMFLNYASYFKANKAQMESIVDFLIGQHMKDGGFNCRSNRSGARHSSLHSTISVLEGITEMEQNGYDYRQEELHKIKESSKEFMLQHQLYKSDRTGEVIHKDFIRLSYPSRWRFDILRALDYLRHDVHPWDERLQSAMDVLKKKRRKDGLWNMQAKHPGQVGGTH